ncbi:MAG: hypothetical protein OEV40_31920 [Acidimicrobiia bacterium]|nr:hypothetical protein [Acidimicrobiia bacterium]
MKMRALTGGIAISLLLAACAGTSTSDDTANQIDTLAPPPAEIASIDVKSGSSPLGDILIGPEGLTLYAFTNDIEATSTCYGTCADAWPPVIVDLDWTAGPGLDFGIFATTLREDGQLQLVAGPWPLYYFAGDGAPGDVNGQGSGDVWFAVDTAGRLITDTPAADRDAGSDLTAEPEAAAGEAAGDPGSDEDDANANADDGAQGAAPLQVAVATTSLGEALVDADGRTLYGFLDDTDGTPTCSEACADAWPPVIVDGPEVPDGLDPAVFSVVERADGSYQLVAGAWPLYTFAGDGAPGDVNGQGSGDVWFVAAPDGKLLGASRDY